MGTIGNYIKNKLKYDKTKSYLIIISIILTTFLLTVIVIIGYDYVGQQRYHFKNIANFHGHYEPINIEQYDHLIHREDIESVTSRWQTVNEYKEHRVILVVVDKGYQDMMNIEQYGEGTYPTLENEVLIDKSYAKFLGYEGVVGEEIMLSYTIKDKGQSYTYNKPFIISGLSTDKQKFRDNLYKQYFVSFSKAFLDAHVSRDNQFFASTVKIADETSLSTKQIKNKVKEIGKEIGLKNHHITIHDAYLDIMKPDYQTIASLAGVCLVIMLAAIVVIYSIFYMSIVSKVQEYGKLLAMGATKKQIKKMVLLEGLYLSGISIPIGLISGTVVGYFIMYYTRQHMPKEMGIFPYNFSLYVLLGCGLLSLITIFIALVKPSRMASKISPIQAIRYDASNYIYNKERKGFDCINLLRLSRLNLIRYKKRTILTLISLTFGGMLFVIIAVLIHSENPHYENRHNSDFNIYNTGTLNIIDNGLIEELSSIDGITQVTIGKYMGVDLHINKTDTERFNLGSFDKPLAYYKERLVSGSIDFDRLIDEHGIIINTYLAEDKNLQVGDQITLDFQDNNETITKHFIIQGIGKFHFKYFLLPNKVLDQFITKNINSSINLSIDPIQYDDIHKQLSDIVNSTANLKMIDKRDRIKIAKNRNSAVKMAGYCLALVIGLISFMNLMNTMMTSIMTRKRELAVLQAIGLSYKQLGHMFHMEGMFYALVSLSSMLVLGNGIGYLMIAQQIKTGRSHLIYQFPVMENALLIGFILTAVFLLTLRVNKSFKKESLIERIRFSE